MVSKAEEILLDIENALATPPDLNDKSYEQYLAYRADDFIELALDTTEEDAIFKRMIGLGIQFDTHVNPKTGEPISSLQYKGISGLLLLCPMADQGLRTIVLRRTLEILQSPKFSQKAKENLMLHFEMFTHRMSERVSKNLNKLSKEEQELIFKIHESAVNQPDMYIADKATIALAHSIFLSHYKVKAYLNLCHKIIDGDDEKSVFINIHVADACAALATRVKNSNHFLPDDPQEELYDSFAKLLTKLGESPYTMVRSKLAEKIPRIKDSLKAIPEIKEAAEECIDLLKNDPIDSVRSALSYGEKRAHERQEAWRQKRTTDPRLQPGLEPGFKPGFRPGRSR